MALVWGVRSVLGATASDYDGMVLTARDEYRKLLEPRIGDKLVILSGVPFGQVGSTNTIRVATFRRGQRMRSGHRARLRHAAGCRRVSLKKYLCIPFLSTDSKYRY